MVELFINGGNFMWPILAIFIVGLVFVGERLMHLVSSSKWGEEFANEVTDTLDSAGALESQSMCEKGQGPIANLLLVGLNNIKKGVDGVEKAIDSRANVEMSSLEKNMTWIALCIATAPMLGFLGTVWGMVSAFDAIAAADNISAKIVAEGISQALLTTAFGLIVAMIIQFFQNFFVSRIDQLILDMEENSVKLLDSLHSKKK